MAASSVERERTQSSATPTEDLRSTMRYAVAAWRRQVTTLREMQELSPEAHKVLRKVLAKVNRVCAPGVGLVDSSWSETEKAHGAFVSELIAWDTGGQKEEGKQLVRDAASSFVNAWREVSEEYQDFQME